MNCERVQKCLFEYIEGSLPESERASVQAHLASCPSCRETLRGHERAGQAVSAEYRRRTERLSLPPEVERRILKALAEQPDKERGSFFVSLMRPRLAWGLAAVCLAVLVVFYRTAPLESGRRPAKPPTAEAARRIIIELSLATPSYSFRREEDRVIDSLSWQTNSVRQIWRAEAAREQDPNKQGKFKL